MLKLFLALCSIILITPLSGQTCGTCPDDQVELYLTADNLQPVPGDIICYSLRTRNFDGVTTFAFTLTFSTETLVFSSLNTMISGLPEFDNSDVSPPTSRDPDIYRFLWGDGDAKPRCIADGGALVEICFQVVGVTGQPIRVAIGANGFPGTGAYAQFARLDSMDMSCMELDEGTIDTDSDMVPTVVMSACDNGVEVVSFNRCGSLPGRSDGTVELQIFCGTGPYQINVDASPAITTTDSVYLLTGLRSGAHIIRVTDMANGTATSPFMVNVPTTAGISFSQTLTQPRCAVSGSTPRGRILISDVTGGTPFAGGKYLFDWGQDNFGIGDSVRSFLPTGNYNLRLSDSLGCTVIENFTLATELIEVIPTTSPARCVGVADGTIGVVASGGVNNIGNGYRFFLQGTTTEGQAFNRIIQPNQSSTATFTGVPSGNFQVWAEDDDFPSGSCAPNPQSAVIGTVQNYSTSISFDSGAGCPAGEQSRQITIQRSEQGASFNYQIWRIDNGVQTLEVSNVMNSSNLDITTGCLPLGTYELRLQDDDGCEFIEEFEIDGCALVVDSLVFAPFCGSPGTISLPALSGADPITYLWSNGETTSSIGDLAVGSYQVTIADADQCSLFYSFTLVEPDAFTIDISAPPVTCPNGLTDITVTPSDFGFPPFVYSWEPNIGTITGDQLIGVPPGNYTVTVTDDDGFGCDVIDSITIPNVTAPTFTLTPVVPPRCQGDPSGVINISISTNSSFPGPFQFEASSGSMGTNSLTFAPANLSSGTQWIVYTTLDGCQFDTVFFNVPEGPKLQIDQAASSFGEIECFGGLTIVNLAATGGANIAYQWPAPYNTGTGNTKIDVAAGEYTISLTSGTCMSVDTILITQPDSFGVSIDQNLSSLPLCSDDLADLVSAVSGGTGPFTYRWEDESGNLVSSDFDANGLGAGMYFVTTTDDMGCVASNMIDITVNDPVIAFFGTPLQPLCFGEAGRIFVDSVQGGRPPYRYQLDTNPATAITDTSIVQSGNHMISVFDLNGCSTSMNFTIESPDQIDVILEGDTNIELGRSGTLRANVDPPTGIDTIIWTSSAGEPISCLTSDCSEISITPINNQTYTATVINEDNCMTSGNITVSVIRSQHVFVPNVFNPGSQIERHRFLQVYAGSGVESIDYLRVFDRWGNMVHEETNLPIRNDGLGTGSWDGTFSNSGGGRQLASGVYVWVIQVRYLGDPAPDVRKGDVTLIR